MGCDTICDLPDSLLTQILLNLRTKDSVRTSVLSTRWRNLWLSVPGLHLATYHFRYGQVFARFIDRFMEFNQGSRLQNFKIAQYHNFDRVNEFIGTVVDRGIQRLDVTMCPGFRYDFMTMNIYKSKTLVSLKLVNVKLKNPEFVVSLPCLKIMHLVTICYGMDGPLVLEKLVSGCPVLEDLELIRPFNILKQEVVLFLRVMRSQTLKRCCLSFAINMSNTDFAVEIDAPRLEYLSLSESRSDNISQLHNFNHLEAPFYSSSLYLLPAFLEGCPNLKSLSLVDFGYSKEPRQIDFTKVPRCLISTLEYVEIKKLMMKDDTGIIKLMNYFLENSAVLKKLTLSFKKYVSITKQEAENYKKLFTSTKLSPTCQVIIDGHAADDEYVT